MLNRSIPQMVPSQYFPVEGAIDPVHTGDPEHLGKGRFMEKCEPKKRENLTREFIHILFNRTCVTLQEMRHKVNV